MQDIKEVQVVSGKAGLIAAVLGSLRFTPADSLVMVSLAGPRRRVRLVGRVDLPSDSITDAEYLAGRDRLTDAVARHGEQVAVVVFSVAPLQRAGLAADAAAGVIDRGRDVAMMLWVNCERYGDYQRPHDGSHLWSAQDLPSALRREVNGRLPTRQHVVNLVAFTGRPGRHADAAMDADRLTTGQRAERAYALLVQAVDAARNDHRLPDDLADDLAVLLTDSELREDLTLRLFADLLGPAASRQDIVATVDALTMLVADTPDPWVEGAAILLAHTAYAGNGNGVLAMSALDRVPATSPAQSTVRVIGQCIDSGVDPRAYRNVLTLGRLQ